MGLLRTTSVRLAVAAASAVAVTVPLLVQADAAGALAIPSGYTHIKVWMRGNGHAHGLSQYGAQGAALAGKTYKQIVGFYYPGTTLATKSSTSKIRVLISGTGNTVQVRAESGLRVTKVGTLATKGISWYRLLADSHSTETLQAYQTSAKKWTTVATGLPEAAYFTRGWYHSTRVRFTDGTETRYFGLLRAIRRSVTGSTGGVGLVNTVTLDDYTRGVVPREMPASWKPAAVSAQAIAARTYGQYAIEHPRDVDYDICDTTDCQVYGGYIHYASDGTRLTTDAPAAVADNAGQVLQYKGTTIFSQFSASNGGWTVNGGQPYMVAKADPYDSADGADPYTLQSKTLKISSLAAAFGLKTLTSIAVTSRDGHGAWGGRVLAGYVTGQSSAGKSVKVSFDGFDLQAAVGAGTTWLAFSKPTK